MRSARGRSTRRSSNNRCQPKREPPRPVRCSRPVRAARPPGGDRVDRLIPRIRRSKLHRRRGSPSRWRHDRDLKLSARAGTTTIRRLRVTSVALCNRGRPVDFRCALLATGGPVPTRATAPSTGLVRIRRRASLRMERRRRCGTSWTQSATPARSVRPNRPSAAAITGSQRRPIDNRGTSATTIRPTMRAAR
jgi:hypothetical protein